MSKENEIEEMTPEEEENYNPDIRDAEEEVLGDPDVEVDLDPDEAAYSEEDVQEIVQQALEDQNSEAEPEMVEVQGKGWKGKVPLAYTAFIRLFVMIILYGASFLTTVFDWDPIPWSEEEVTQAVTLGVTFIYTVYTWYTNNPVTEYGKKKEEVGRQEVGSRKEQKENKLGK